MKFPMSLSLETNDDLYRSLSISIDSTDGELSGSHSGCFIDSSFYNEDASLSERRESEFFHGTYQFTASGDSVEVNTKGMTVGSKYVGLLRLDESNMISKDRFQLLSKLGSGATSTVYKAIDIPTSNIFAVKIIKVNNRANKEQMINEFKAWYSLKNKPKRTKSHVVNFIDAFSCPEDNTVYIVLEYMDGGSLHNIISNSEVLDEAKLSKISLQLLEGLKFLHENGQIHRDIKPANLLLSKKGELKITDLGLMEELNEKEEDSKLEIRRYSASFLGTSAYMSPERLEGLNYGFSADIWSFGMVLMVLATGKLPFNHDEGYWKLLDSIKKENILLLPTEFSAVFQDFMDKCLVKRPEERWDCEKLLKHPFITRDIQMINFTKTNNSFEFKSTRN